MVEDMVELLRSLIQWLVSRGIRPILTLGRLDQVYFYRMHLDEPEESPGG